MSNETEIITVLITDDIPQNRAYIYQLIQSVLINAHIEEAEDGEMAMHKVAEKIKRTSTSFDLIIMDFKMPKMNGEQATMAIREIEQTAKLTKPSIIITWSSALNTPYKNADDWLPKTLLGEQDLVRLLRTFGFIRQI